MIMTWLRYSYDMVTIWLRYSYDMITTQLQRNYETLLRRFPVIGAIMIEINVLDITL